MLVQWNGGEAANTVRGNSWSTRKKTKSCGLVHLLFWLSEKPTSKFSVIREAFSCLVGNDPYSKKIAEDLYVCFADAFQNSLAGVVLYLNACVLQ